MNAIERNIYVLDKRYVAPISYKKGSNAIPIRLTLADYEIPSGAEAKVYVEKPSTKATYNTATIEGNVVVVKPTTQTFSEAGLCNMQVKITKGSDVLITFSYPVDVEENTVSDDAPQSGNQSDFIDEYFAEKNNQLSALQNAVNAAKDSANTAAANANAAADEARETVWNNKNLTNFTSAAVSEVTTAESAAVLTGIDGKTKQTTTTGAQLLDVRSKISSNSSGLTVSFSGDGELILNGTTADVNSPDIYLAGTWGATKPIATGTTALKVYGATSDEEIYLINGTTSVHYKGDSSITSEQQVTAVMIRMSKGKTYSNFRIKPMLNAGKTALPWEPYSGGIPAPNPDYPIPIQGVGGQTGGESFGFKAVVQSENLFAPIVPTYSAGGATVTNNGDGSYTITGSGNLTSVSQSARIELDILPILKTGMLRLNVEKTMPQLQVIGYGSDVNSDRLFVLTSGNSQANITENILQKIKGVFAVFYGNANATITPITVKPMLGYVENGAEFQPYLHSEIPITLSQPIFEGDKLMQVKAGQSYVDVDGATQTADRDLWGVHHQNRVLKFDGTEIWNENGVVEGATKKRYTTAINGDDLERVVDSDVVNGKSNMFSPASAYVGYEGQTECFSVQNDRFSYLNVYCGFQTVDEWKNHLKTSNMFAVLKAGVPYFEPFADQTPFLDWHTPEGGCTITTDDPMEPIISVYTAQTPEGSYLLTGYVDGLKGRTLEDRIKALEQAAVQNI